MGEPKYKILEWNAPVRLSALGTLDPKTGKPILPPKAPGVYVLTQFNGELKPNPFRLDKKTYDNIVKRETRTKLRPWTQEFKKQYVKSANESRKKLTRADGEKGKGIERVLYVGEGDDLSTRGLQDYSYQDGAQTKHKGKVLLWANQVLQEYLIDKHLTDKYGGQLYIRWATKYKDTKDKDKKDKTGEYIIAKPPKGSRTVNTADIVKTADTSKTAEKIKTAGPTKTAEAAETCLTIEVKLINELRPDLNTKDVEFVKPPEIKAWLQALNTGDTTKGLQEWLEQKRSG